jgi:CheY-like chemotaxis protein
MTKILLVEDDKSLREIYGVRLLAEGYDIVSAGDGEEALAMAIKERPQLIISDVMMPKISGFDMLDILRSTTETRDIKVIMMTALSSEDQRARGQALGADRYLVKSQVGIEDVVRTVHEVLGDAPVVTPSPTQAFGGPAPSSSTATTPRPAAIPPRQPQPTPIPISTPQTPPAATDSPQPQSNTTPAPAPPPQTPSAALPQPTAPFSTTRPANLGERVIHPIAPASSPDTDLANRINQELQGASSPPATNIAQQQVVSTPQTPTTPAPPEPPAPIIPDNQSTGIEFEEIPRPPQPPTPPNSQTPPPVVPSV